MRRDRSGDSPKSAADLLGELQSDPEFVARAREREARQQSGVAAYARAAAPILSELAVAGLQLTSIGDLRRESRDRYRKALPTLIGWLPRTDDPRVREDIVRTLSMPWANPEAGPVLMHMFMTIDDETNLGIRWAVGNALAVVASRNILDDLLAATSDKRYGRAREMAVVGLGSIRDRRAVEALIGYLDDEDLAGHAAMGLAKAKDRSAIPTLRRLLDHPKEWVRREVGKALQAMEGGSKS